MSMNMHLYMCICTMHTYLHVPVCMDRYAYTDIYTRVHMCLLKIPIYALTICKGSNLYACSLNKKSNMRPRACIRSDQESAPNMHYLIETAFSRKKVWG